MKTFKMIALLLLLVIAGGFIYFSIVDVPVEQTSVSKEIPHERFADE